MLVLLLGYRQQIAQVLESKGIPFCIWSEKPLKKQVLCQKIIIEDYPHQIEDGLSQLAGLPITHVIAGTEATVYLASRLRKALGARSNPDTAIILCHDKIEMKEFLRDRKIPMTDFLRGNELRNPNAVISRLGSTVVVKSRVGSGGRGLVWVDQDPEKLRHLLTDDVIIESPIKGTEGSVESLIQDGRVLFTNITRYTKVGTENRVPGDYPQEIQRDILELNQRVLSEIGIQWGLTHLEFYHTEANQILFGEVALRPPGGYIMQAMELAYDYDFWRAFVEIELGQSVTPPSVQAMAFAASVIFHPGEKSKITRIEGKAEAKALASMVKVRIKVKVGDSVKNRTSVGEDVGYALLKHEDPDQLTKDLEALHQTLHID